MDKLDPWALADHLLVPIKPLSDYGQDAPRAVRHFTEIDPGAFSACTVFDGARRTIVHNDAHLGGCTLRGTCGTCMPLVQLDRKARAPLAAYCQHREREEVAE